MKWPLVSRRAYDLLLAECDRSRSMVDDLLEHVTRMDRTEHGLLELPYTKPDPPEPLPEALQDYVDGWQDCTVRRQVVRSILLARQDGKSWDAIIDECVLKS